MSVKLAKVRSPRPAPPLESQQLTDEQSAAAALGYTIRPNHPWTLLKEARRHSVATGRRADQLVFGVPDST